MAAQHSRGVPLSTLNPKFLHTNSTSHTWPFSAIAELIDNAYDPDVSAKQLWIDKTVVKGKDCLSFMDNGNGLDCETMHKMLSFGFSDKTAVNGVLPIGLYGNGFKSGSMRLGKDAIVFSKSRSTSCVGMLSQSYLEKIEANEIAVPIVGIEHTETSNFSVREEHKVSLQDILQHSPFTTRGELLNELKAITRMGETGTRIIIWNLRRTSTGALEFDFQTDRYDMQIPPEVYDSDRAPQLPVSSHIPKSLFSLRAYCSLLYLKPRMQINIRSLKVKSELIAKSLASTRKDFYKPSFLNKRISITFGYNTKSKDQFGLMIYHKNRLIKAYERVGCQLKANSQGVGVIGIIECNYLQPTHNKQSFDETDQYRKTMTSVAIKLDEYCKEISYDWRRRHPDNTRSLEDAMKQPDQMWVQCNDCSRWRKLPDGVDSSKLPEDWFCHMNPDPQFRNCQVEEEPEDSDDDRPAYSKPYKQQERMEKKKQQLRMQKEEEERICEEKQSVADLTKLNKELKRKLRQRPVQSVSAPTTPNDSRQRASASTSQAACTPTTNDGFPVISAYYSLLEVPQRKKRKPSLSLQRAPKRVLAKGFHSSPSDTSNSTDARSPCSPSLLAGGGHDDNGDIVIMEDASTPKSCPAVTEVKIERESTDISMLLECSDDAAVEPIVNNANSTQRESNGPAGHPGLTSNTATTQTEVARVKEEAGDPIQTGNTKGAGQSTSPINGVEQCSKACSTDRMVIKEESREDASSGRQGNAPNGVARHLESGEVAGPSRADAHQPSITRVEELKEQHLDMVQKRDQATQTLKTEEIDYKSMLEGAKNKIDELVKDKVALLSAAESRAEREDKDSEEVALQVDSLMRELDQKQRENDELRFQMESVQEEKAILAAQCEELRLKLQQQSGSPEEGTSHSAAGGAAGHQDTGEAARPTLAGGDSHSGTFRSLLELRQNVGRLLITHVPYLELDQVNYKCNVIDEILEQYLSERDHEETALTL